MKFGRNLPQSQVPEWAAAYIDYKGLKKLIKNEAEKGKAGADAQPDTAAFFYALDRNLEDIDTFYNKKYADSSRRLKLLQDQYGRSQDDPTVLDRDEVEDLTSALLDLRSALRKLQWYGEVNRRGFVKITKKLDKKLGLPKGATQKPYNEAKVDLRPFAKDAPLLEVTAVVNEWLSKLGEVTSDEESLAKPPFSLSRVPSRTKLNLPEGIGEKIDAALRDDQGEDLLRLLKDVPGGPSDPAYHRLILSLLSKAIGKKARSCITRLLGMIDGLEDPEDINQRNCLHRFLVSLNRTQQNETSGTSSGTNSSQARTAAQFITPAAPPIVSSPYPTKESDRTDLDGTEDEAVKLLVFLLTSLKPSQRAALKVKDNLGRTLLHYAAFYGFAGMCQIIATKMKEWDQFEIDLGIHAPWLRDAEGMSPIHLAVIGGHPMTTKTLLASLEGAALRSQFIKDPQVSQKFGECLAQAVQADFADIVEMLLKAGAKINYQDGQGESALHIASRLGKVNSLVALLNGLSNDKVDLELREKTFEWTPLFFACKENNIEIVKLLLNAGADAAKPDPGGWTAQEHAALRGHLEIAGILNECTNRGPPTTNGLGTASMEPIHKPSRKERKEKEKAAANNKTTISTEPVKTFGHRYLTDKSMILVSLGTMNLRRNTPAVDLKQIPVAEAHRTQLDTALSVVITAEGAEGEPEVVDLPVQGNISTEPFTFMSNNVMDTTLHFDIVPTYAGSPDKIIGRGSALISSCKPNVGLKRMPLQGDIAVPIHAAQTLKIIGTVNFNFLIIHPFSHPKISLTERSTYWKKTTQAMVIGHRGLGKNMTSRKALQLGENTIQSFISAANLGASYVEFDVQLTKDHVPIIYHDFLVSETGIDAPVHTLTLEQFLHINPERAPSPSPMNGAGSDSDNESNDSHVTTRNGRGRAYSLDTNSLLSGESVQMDERMKHTRDFKVKGFKANSRGKFIQAPFTTLEKMLRTLPKELSFNIEMKYPMLWESEDQEMDPYAVDLNVFVDTVLKMVYDLGTGREIIFSSFNPDVCLLLAFKQPSIPVLFLTDAGASPVGDVRASSLQEAIRFASRWDLLGIVSQASAFVLSPRLISLVKENGLMCISYGTQNNDPEKVQLQEDEGIDAVITDDILQIKKARLTKSKHETGMDGTTNGTPNGAIGGAIGGNGIKV